ncbi:hypothetical protein [Marinibactrum halimedae]|uniref:Uncharacterized protein n=1 Tax=Marinibactrum halimedae TaxID=1444977 RepID=A0AA37T3Y1_9GAMM|nr:hypothetical protein [Marinibactrum halimedae]MCD9460733.1 hypothetical protein [Marinibactrum halimedae]GLS25141.1 hypothetical protein GCM10007877_08550 [Marinibactrum halimedae]
MRVKHIKNGDLSLSNKSWFFLCLLICLLLVNFIAGGHYMLTHPVSSWGPGIYIQLPLLAVLGFFLGRAFTRKSEFYFDHKNKTVSYSVQSMWNEDKGVLDIAQILEVIIQEGGTTDGGDSLERLAIRCRNKTIPMSATYTNTMNFKSIKEEIDEWLHENKND